MQFYLISDNVDTRIGMRLSGIDAKGERWKSSHRGNPGIACTAGFEGYSRKSDLGE